jgi:hypothetical protein
VKTFNESPCITRTCIAQVDLYGCITLWWFSSGM